MKQKTGDVSHPGGGGGEGRGGKGGGAKTPDNKKNICKIGDKLPIS